VSECDREAATIGRPWPTKDCCIMEKKYDSEARLYSTERIRPRTEIIQRRRHKTSVAILAKGRRKVTPCVLQDTLDTVCAEHAVQGLHHLYFAI
jgi:hypothetical protein